MLRQHSSGLSPSTGAECEAGGKQRRVRADHLCGAPCVLPAHLPEVAGGGGHLPGLLRGLVQRARGDFRDGDGGCGDGVQGPGVWNPPGEDARVLLLFPPIQARSAPCASRQPADTLHARYQDRLVAFLLANPDFIRPEAQRNAILSRLQREPLLDLSISRTTFSWGIPVPEDPKHVMCATSPVPVAAMLILPAGMCGSTRSPTTSPDARSRRASAASSGRLPCTSLVSWL